MFFDSMSLIFLLQLVIFTKVNITYIESNVNCLSSFFCCFNEFMTNISQRRMADGTCVLKYEIILNFV